MLTGPVHNSEEDPKLSDGGPQRKQVGNDASAHDARTHGEGAGEGAGGRRRRGGGGVAARAAAPIPVASASRKSPPMARTPEAATWGQSEQEAMKQAAIEESVIGLSQRSGQRRRARVACAGLRRPESERQ